MTGGAVDSTRAASLRLASPGASSITTRRPAASAGSSGSHIVELMPFACSATTGGAAGSPAASTCVAPNDVARSDCSTGMGEAATDVS